MTRTIASLALSLIAVTAFAEEPGQVADGCAAIEDDRKRLDCYDTASDRPSPSPLTFLERHWDLRDESRPFQLWAHGPNYALPARWTTDGNDRPFAALAAPRPKSVEAKFQISFKSKLLRNLFGGNGDLWFGYTQQSHFQIYNKRASRPFRETDFAPELLVSFPARRSWGSWTVRMAGAGFLHQSNGRSEPLSRSWNRLFLLAGIERGSLVFHVRPWVRVDSTSTSQDDNPGISDLVGRMDVVARWSHRRQVLTVRGRSNLDAGRHKGSLEANWYFPIHERLRGQLQLFTGYGESLIDYDHNQTTVGLGVQFFDLF